MTLRDQPRDIWKNTQTPPTYSRERCSWYLSRVFAIPDQNNILCNLKLFRIFLLSFFALDQGQASIHHNRCFFVWLVKHSPQAVLLCLAGQDVKMCTSLWLERRGTLSIPSTDRLNVHLTAHKSSRVQLISERSRLFRVETVEILEAASCRDQLL